MIITLGLHRRKRNGGYNFEIGLIEHECRKRTFWIAYILDRYLSLMGGRPRIIQDFDIDQELPARVDDIDLTDSEIRTRVGLFDSQMDAPLMHIKYSKPLSTPRVRCILIYLQVNANQWPNVVHCVSIAQYVYR